MLANDNFFNYCETSFNSQSLKKIDYTLKLSLKVLQMFEYYWDEIWVQNRSQYCRPIAISICFEKASFQSHVILSSQT